jgi:hypothetical protein
MKYRITGSNRETGARMTLEFDADSKAAAERKANKSGMEVNHVQNLDQPDLEPRARSDRLTAGAPVGGVKAKLISAIVFVLIAAGLVWIFLPKIRALLSL